MNEPIELQGMTFEEFNILMKRLSVFSSDWANHIKINNNMNTITEEDLFLEYSNTSYYKDNTEKEIRDIIQMQSFIPEHFETKSNKSHHISNYKCCVVGEAHNNTDDYNDIDSKKHCNSCREFARDIIGGNTKGNYENGILHLKTLKEFVKHMEDYHATN